MDVKYTLNGERIEDVTAHPAYQNSIRSVAQLYDAMHDPKTKRYTDDEIGCWRFRYT